MHDSSSGYFLSHHEWSESRRLYQSVNRLPEIGEFKISPRWALKKFLKYIFLKYLVKPPISISVKNPVVLFWDNRCTENFFHWMVDALVRLNLFIDARGSDRPLLIIPESAINRAYLLPTLECFGFGYKDILWLRADKRYKAQKISAVSPGIYSTGACSSGSISKVRERLGIKSGRGTDMIYLARKPIFGRKISNEVEFEVLITGFGFTKMYPEDYPFELLKDLLGRAKVVIGVHGAALANCIFMPQVAFLIEIANADIIAKTPEYWDDKYPAKYTGDYYYSLASACKLNYCFIPCERADRAQGAMVADISVDLELVFKSLKMIYAN